MKTIITTLCTAALIGLLFGCTDQRDLYVASSPLLLIENNWTPAQIDTDNGATTAIYSPGGRQVELMPDAEKLTVKLDAGMYDIMVFNGLMYSPEQSHLDYIRYRGVDRFETFEAYVTEMAPTATFRPQPGEVIVNNPDLLATYSTAGTDIEGRKQFQLKYNNGTNSGQTTPNYIEDSLRFVPCRVTQQCQVIVHTTHPKSARIIRGSLRGFAGSVFMAHRMPSHSNITHQFTLNGLVFDQPDPAIGTISSPLFTTFGPPLDLPGREYQIELNVLLSNNEELPSRFFDVTKQVTSAINRLNEERQQNQATFAPIVIELWMELPPVISDDLDIGVGDWGNDIIIPVPLH